MRSWLERLRGVSPLTIAFWCSVGAFWVLVFVSSSEPWEFALYGGSILFLAGCVYWAERRKRETQPAPSAVRPKWVIGLLVAVLGLIVLQIPSHTDPVEIAIDGLLVLQLVLGIAITRREAD